MSVLDADMGEVARRIGEGWRWWTAELAAMVPPRWRRGARRPVALVEADGTVRVTRRGRQAIVPAGTPVIAAVRPERVLVRTLTLPALGERDLRWLVDLQLDRLMPFAPGVALIDVAPGRVEEDGRREVAVAALPVAAGVETEAAVRAAGLVPTALRVAAPDDALAHDFLPALRAARGDPDPRAGRRAWWRLAALLFALNVALLVVTDMLALRNVERLVEAHASTADGVRRARRRVEGEEAGRRALVVRRVARDPLPILADLSRRVPAGVSVDRLTIAPEGIRIAGVRPPQIDMLGALRAGGHYPRVRNAGDGVLAATPEGQPYDIGFGWPARR